MLILGDERPVARKQHRCELCCRAIEVGETYRRLRIIGDDPYVWKECGHCSELWLLTDVQYDEYEGYTREDFLECEPRSWTEARWLVQFRKHWRRPDGSLHPVPACPGGAA